jgi:hypothetical protein
VHVTTTQYYAAFATQAREATEKSVTAFKLATRPLADAAQADVDVPKVFAEPVQEYIQYVQRAAQMNVELATTWTQLVASFSGVTGFSGVPAGRATKTNDAAQKAVESAGDSAQTVVEIAATTAPVAQPTPQEQVDEAGESEPALALEAERAEAKHANEVAREPYRSLTRAELSALLAERGLPKTGTVGVLVERLVAADRQS